MMISIDPGVKTAGVACWEDDELISAWLSKGETWDRTAFNVLCCLEDHFPKEIILSAHAVIERPQVYREEFLKGDPNDLITLALMVGATAGYLINEPTLYYPREWKGQVPKDTMIERIKGKLSEEEYRRVDLPRAKSLHHNIWDAVGIGLYQLGRLGRRYASKQSSSNGHRV